MKGNGTAAEVSSLKSWESFVEGVREAVESEARRSLGEGRDHAEKKCKGPKRACTNRQKKTTVTKQRRTVVRRAVTKKKVPWRATMATRGNGTIQ